MPRNSTLRRGVSGRDALINSGGEQFLAEVESITSPVTLTITFANLQDGTDFAGTSGFTGNPAWTSNATNYIWFDKNTSTLVNNSTGFPTTPNIIPLWRLALDVSGDFVSIFDSRPWFVQNAPNPNQGLEVDSTSLDIRNTNPTSSWVTCSDPDTELNWDLGSETLTVTTSDLRVTAFLDGAFHTNVVTAGSSITNVNGVSGDVIFVDLGGASGSSVSLQQSTVAAYTPQQNRVVLGNRVGSDIIWNNKFLIRDSGASVEYIAQACGIGLSKDVHEGLANAPTAPTSANPFITLADSSGGSVSQGNLNTANESFSVGASIGWTNITFSAAGQYGFYPQVRGVFDGNNPDLEAKIANNRSDLSFVTSIALKDTSGTSTAWFMETRILYIQSSPPHFLLSGNKEDWGQWVMVAIERSSGDIKRSWSAEDPWYWLRLRGQLPKGHPGMMLGRLHPFVDDIPYEDWDLYEFRLIDCRELNQNSKFSWKNTQKSRMKKERDKFIAAGISPNELDNYESIEEDDEIELTLAKCARLKMDAYNKDILDYLDPNTETHGELELEKLKDCLSKAENDIPQIDKNRLPELEYEPGRKLFSGPKPLIRVVTAYDG